MTKKTALITFCIAVVAAVEPSHAQQSDVQEEVHALIGRLQSSDPSDRRGAVRALGALGPQAHQAVPALIQALADSHESISYYATEALGNIGPAAGRAIPHLVLKFSDGSDRSTVASALRKIDPAYEKSAIGLIQTLLDGDCELRNAAAESLANGDIEVRKGLLEIARCSKYELLPRYQLAAETWLLSLDQKVDELLTRLKSENAATKEAASLVLWQRGDDRATEELLRAAARRRGQEHQLWRNRALDFKEALPKVLADMQTSENVGERVLAESLAVELNDPNLLEQFHEDLENACHVTQLHVWRVTNLKGAGKSLAYLFPDDRHGRIYGERLPKRDRGEHHSDTLQERRLNQAYIPLLEATCLFEAIRVSRGLRPRLDIAAFALAEFKEPQPEQTIPALINLLKNEDIGIRIYALATLSRIGPAAEQGVPDLILALNDEDIGVRYHAVSTLGQIGPAAKEAVPGLIKLMKTRDRGMRSLATEALGRVGAAAAPSLIQVLKEEEDKYVRLHAIFALEMIEPPPKEAVGALTQALTDKDGSIRRYAERVLQKIQQKQEQHEGKEQQDLNR